MPRVKLDHPGKGCDCPTHVKHREQQRKARAKAAAAFGPAVPRRVFKAAHVGRVGPCACGRKVSEHGGVEMIMGCARLR